MAKSLGTSSQSTYIFGNLFGRTSFTEFKGRQNVTDTYGGVGKEQALSFIKAGSNLASGSSSIDLKDAATKAKDSYITFNDSYVTYDGKRAGSSGSGNMFAQLTKHDDVVARDTRLNMDKTSDYSKEDIDAMLSAFSSRQADVNAQQLQGGRRFSLLSGSGRVS